MRAVPPSYSPYRQLATTVGSAYAIAIIAAMSALHRATALTWLAVPACVLLAVFVEWTLHSKLMHHRRSFAKAFYDEHAGRHHPSFTMRHMAVRSAREWSLILLDVPQFLGLLGLMSVLGGIAGIVFGTAVGLVCLSTFAAYVATYELTHLACHLPWAAAPERSRIVRAILSHHARHHDTRLMKSWNFNIIVPLADWALGTLWRPRPKNE
jgi:hypothetical protein